MKYLWFFFIHFVEELPYINVPLHTIIKLTISGYKCKMEVIKLNIECVDTYRMQPKVCVYIFIHMCVTFYLLLFIDCLLVLFDTLMLF